MVTNKKQEMVGAVIVFAKGTDLEKAQLCLDEIFKRGALEHSATARKFDPAYGGPVWYIP